MERRVPFYSDSLIERFHRGEVGRLVHLGHWDEPPSATPPDEFRRAQQRLNDILLGMADLCDGQAVLDVGCGLGGALADINQRYRNMRLVGVNIDSRQLGICGELEQLNQNQLSWIAADACALPLPAAGLDRLLCIEAGFHFASRRVFLHEAARVLRPGGVLVLADILLSPPIQNEECPGFVNEAALRDGYGPWPDVWGEDADYYQLSAASGLRCVQEIDATANTQPSHRFTVPGDLDERQAFTDPGVRAALTLRWLHHRGHLRYVYLRFDKPK